VVDGARSRRAGAHYWARELMKLGHKVRLIEVLAASAGETGTVRLNAESSSQTTRKTHRVRFIS
jgi:hypothetical protein